MLVTADPEEARAWAADVRRAGLSLGLVPTMGALHTGHFTLLDRARSECDRAAVTIFVNPSQFGPKEDLARYPRTLEADLAGCRSHGADLVLAPERPDAIYPPGFQTWIEVGPLAEPLCGKSRPGHFRGVATVVAILFGLFRPHRAYFGQKDYQQALLVERVAADLRLGPRVVVVPTVREADGLALSSRNRYLSPEERARALAIPGALRAVEEAYRSGEARASALEALLAGRLGPASGLRLDYARVLDARDLVPIAGDRIDRSPAGAVAAVAAFSGATRLIDNVLLPAGGAGHGENRETGKG